MTPPLIDLHPDHWAIVRTILQTQVPQYPVWAFGSRATWKAKEFSDLDLAIITETPLPLDVMASLREAFSDSDLPWKVDVVDWASTSAAFREIIERDKVVVQEGQAVVGGSEWNETRLGDLLSFANGRSSPDRADELPYPVYGSNGIIGYTDQTNSVPKTIIIGRVGSYCGSVYLSIKRCWVTDNAIRANVKNMNDPVFLYYLVKGLDLNSRRSGSGQPLLNQNILESVRVFVPDPVEQRAIAHVLGTLDDKIDLNRRMNATLEAMARALFKDWFVDFGPTRAKLEGRAPYLPPDLWALFPDRLDDDGKPEGWEIKALEDVTAVIRRGISPVYKNSDGVIVLNQKCIRNGGVNFDFARLHDGGKKNIEGRELIPGDILVNSTGVGTLGRVAQIIKVSDKIIVDSHITIVRADSDLVNHVFLGFELTSREKDIEGLGEGTTGQTELSRARLGKLAILLPGSDLQYAFQNSVLPFLSKIEENKAESRTLAQTRDLLLPKLMSGEIRLNPAEFGVLADTPQ